MGTRVSYPVEVKQKAVEMRLAGVPMKEIMQKLNIKNKTQVQTWVRWHKAGIHTGSNSLLENNIPMERVPSTLPN
nr:helix-turn-helix domain-containing protein [Bacillus pumilus]